MSTATMKTNPGLAQQVEPAYERSKRRFSQHFTVFEVEGILYRELRYGFEKWSESAFPAMFGALEEVTPEEGRLGSTEHPIRVSDCTTAEFESVLEVMYPTEPTPVTLGKDEWVGVLKLSRLWNMPKMAAIAIENISSDLSPTEKVALGKASVHRVPAWTREGYTAIVGDSSKMTLDSLSAFGWEAAARVLWAWKAISTEAHPYLANLKAVDIVNHIVDREFEPEELEPLPSEPKPLWVTATQDQPVPGRPGVAGLICFAMDGVYVSRDCIQTPTLAIRDFGHDAGGWRVEKHVRLVGDTTGNGRSDIIGFGDAGVYISRNNGDDTFSPPLLVLDDFGYHAGGWRVEKHLRYAIDLRKKGYVDIIGFGNLGVYVALNNGNGTFSPPTLVLPKFGYHHDAGGWSLDRHLRFLADVTGNGLPDIIGFGEAAVSVSLNNGDGTFQDSKITITNFTKGWLIDKHVRTVCDLTGNGQADIVGFADDGVYVALSAGDGTFHPPQLVSKQFCALPHGWAVGSHPRFAADTTGDGRGDIVGFANAGFYVAASKGDGTFNEAGCRVSGFGIDSGWRVGRHLRFLADLTGNGMPDIIGFGENEVWVSYGDGTGGFSPAKVIGGYFSSSAGNWSTEKTVRYVTNLYA